jgi:aromatic-amino-acid transaminase
MAPRDPILGLNEQFAADPNPNKVNLGVGVYYDENGKLPLLKCVAAAEQQLVEAPSRAATCPSTASPPTTRRCRAWCSVPTARWARPRGHRAGPGRHRGPEGRRRLPQARAPGPVLISDPSWENHRALFTRAGFEVGDLPVLRRLRDAAASTLPACSAALQAAPPAPSSCCTPAATTRPATTSRPSSGPRWCSAVKSVRPGAFLDMAYQGFGEGMAEDGAVIGQFMASGWTSSSPPRFRRASRSTASASAR